MKGSPNIARIGALIGDPARAAMLTALMSGKALTASELAREAGVTIQTASSHLSKLQQGDLLHLRKQGRHKYFTLANDDVAHVLEGIMGLVAGNDMLKTRIGPRDMALRNARVCYNHLAGDKGIQLYRSLLGKGHLLLDEKQLGLSASGHDFTTGFGIDVEQLKAAKAPLCRECLDWSERRSHLAGSLGRAFLTHMEALGWLKRARDSRVIRFTISGEGAFDSAFGIE
ncbi:MAG: transcriptional regulator [marine bacterium B5-7]|nr:MAG: transcriptional regulator [marine bacterium B5-7]